MKLYLVEPWLAVSLCGSEDGVVGWGCQRLSEAKLTIGVKMPFLLEKQPKETKCLLP